MRIDHRLLSSLLLTSLVGLFASRSADAPQLLMVHQDQRAGTVVDRQGTALVRPVPGDRWTPLRQRSVLMPGDLVKTSLRGANAVEVRLAGGGSLVLGPGSVVEMKSGGELHLQRGELELAGPLPAKDQKAPAKEQKADDNKVGGTAGTELVLTAAGGFRRTVAVGASLLVAVRNGKAEVLAAAPRWLTGYRSSTTNEWMGSLIAKVDGRNVPLSVGYHNVDVVIRDQIARTTIEQSFVNNTAARLEGVFYFPLPADASISGFGMWIGSELVEADIVEKGRARQIFEDIMRRKKDPGLLEWGSGNMFKARVFPIEPHSEKRIRIRYTQVLPLEGSTIRYRYGLRSELLRSRPLKQLQVHVTMQSSLPILAAQSTTHEVQVRNTKGAASVHFDAEEYAPDRDFEARFQIDRSQALTVVPHVRGTDGYFMVLLSPPGEGGEWRRELMPEGAPLDLLVLADTSASMDDRARTQQATFVHDLLSLLGEKDRFQVLTCDAFVHAFRPEPSPISSANIDAAITFLDARPSMGWTDLPKMMAEARAHLRPGTVVVYVGDGIGTTGAADSVALAAKLKAAANAGANSIHAVTVSSTYEKVVLEAMTSATGGSVRTASDDIAQAAFGLLTEVAQPAIKNLSVSFRGVRTARVYPEALPNLPRGAQQVVLGRFLPGKVDEVGEVVARGMLDGKQVQFSAAFRLPAGTTGNSFLPRLWARQHVDALLAQGRTSTVKEDVVALSEEFGIMTPYTSFLVLESDEDRERYGVARRVKMRDGEQFFADGRDAANTELLRQQMKLARAWRLNLRARMLREIAGLGRGLYGWNIAHGEVAARTLETATGTNSDAGWSEVRLGAVWGSTRQPSLDYDIERQRNHDDPAPTEAMAPGSETDALLLDKGKDLDAPAEEPADELEEREDEVYKTDIGLSGKFLQRRIANTRYDSYARDGRRASSHGGFYRGPGDHLPPGRFGRRSSSSVGFGDLGFPHLGQPWRQPAFERKPHWPKDVIELLASVGRRQRLEAIGDGTASGGVSIRQTTEDLHPVQGRVASRSASSVSYGKDTWIAVAHSGAWQQIDWLFKNERGVAMTGLGLGRHRPAAPTDRRFPIGLADGSLTDFVATYHRYSAALRKLDSGLIEVTFADPTGSATKLVLTVDPVRRAIVEQRVLSHGRVSSRSVHADLVEVLGMFWPQRIEHFDSKGRLVRRQSIAVTAITAEALEQNAAATRPDPSTLILIDAKDPKLHLAKQAQLQGKATFAEHARVALHHAATQNWDKMWSEWSRAINGLQSRVGVAFMQATLQVRSRRHQEFVAQSEQLLRALAAIDAVDRRAAAWHVYHLAGQVLAPRQRLAFLQRLQPHITYGEQPELAQADRQFREALAAAMQVLGRHGESLKLRIENSERHQGDHQAAMTCANALAQFHGYQRVTAFASAALARANTWTEEEQDGLYRVWTDALYSLGRWEEIDRVTGDWTSARPDSQDAWTRRLSTWLHRNEVAKADTWVLSRLTERRGFAPQQTAVLRAAIQMALGQGWGFSCRRVEEQFRQPLAALVAYCQQDDEGLPLAQQIVGNWIFRSLDEYRELQRARVALMRDGTAVMKLSLPQLQAMVGSIGWASGTQVSDEDWARSLAALKARYEAAEQPAEVDVARQMVLTLLDARGKKDDAIAFLRLALAKVDVESRSGLARQLFERLIAEVWDEARTTELFALLPQLLPADADEGHRTRVAAGAARWLAEALPLLRRNAILGPVDKLEKLPRAERRDAERKALLQARAEVAALLDAQAGTKSLFARWLAVEAAGLSAQAGADLLAVETKARALLAAMSPIDEDDPSAELHAALRARCSLLLAYASVKRGAPAEIATRTLELYVGKQATDDDDARQFWRYQQFRLLVALDRQQELQQVLPTWIEPGKVVTAWRKALAYLHAEVNRLVDASKVLEGVETADELETADYQNLQNWYLVLGNETARLSAMRRKYETMSEYQLRNRVQSENNKLAAHRGSVQVIDPETVTAAQVMLKKAQQPGNHLWTISSLYATTKDHRILSALPFGVLFHSQGGVYQFVQQAGPIQRGIHEEATCDALRTALRDSEPQAKGAIDRRGLMLLSALVHVRAGEVKNQPGPNVEHAIAALRQAMKGDFEPGERALMATTLAAFANSNFAALVDELLTHLEVLYRDSDGAPIERLQVARSLAQALWMHKRRDRAVERLEMALGDYKAAHDRLEPEANDIAQTLVSYQISLNRFAAAEHFVLENRNSQVLQSQRDFYQRQLCNVYVGCVDAGGRVSLGSGAKLFAAARQLMNDELFQTHRQQANQVFAQLIRLFRVGHQRGIDESTRDLRAFAKEGLAELVQKFIPSHASFVQGTAAALAETVNHREALELLVANMEREASWLRRTGSEGWRHYSWAVAEYRTKAGRIGGLETRLLRLVTDELRRDLLSLEWRSTSIFYKNNSYFWHAKIDDFADVAKAVIRDNPASLAIVGNAAQYLYAGLDHRSEAVAALEDIDRQGKLSPDWRYRMVTWMHEMRRFRESLPHLENLIEQSQDNLSYRLMKALALFETRQIDVARSWFEATEKRWRDLKRIDVNVLVALAQMAEKTNWWDKGAVLFDEAIKAYERARHQHWNYQNNLSSYYQSLSHCLVELKRYDEAIQAACGGVVAWGNNQEHRQKALDRLLRTMRRLPDVPAYVRRWDDHVGKSGLDAPLIRKYLGHLLLEQRDYPGAVQQLKLARELQPLDSETHGALLKAFDGANDQKGAVAALIESIRMSPLDLDLYVGLGLRLQKLGDVEGVERAFTSLVEVKPEEAEGHRRLAGLRQDAGRFADAAEQWRHVVRIRDEEPDGWFCLAKAQQSAGDTDAARATLRSMQERKWEERFGNVHAKAGQLLTAIGS